MPPTLEEKDQQRRIVVATQADVAALLAHLNAIQARVNSYNALGLSDDQTLSSDSFEGTGTTVAKYRATIVSLSAFLALLPAGHRTNLESFCQ